jgi:hypothetical protein
MDPVMTQPTDGESLKMCETDDGSMSLSCAHMSTPCLTRPACDTYGHLLLRDDYRAVLAPHAQ